MHEVEHLYREESRYIRPNANLPGEFVFAVTEINREADETDDWYQLLERSVPGYDAAHNHKMGPECAPGVEMVEGYALLKWACGKWNWGDFGNPDRANPCRGFTNPYLQLSRAEKALGSQQAVMSFQGRNQLEIPGAGIQPSLMPAQPGPSPTVIVMNGAKELKQKPSFPKRLFGGR